MKLVGTFYFTQYPNALLYVSARLEGPIKVFRFSDRQQ